VICELFNYCAFAKLLPLAEENAGHTGPA